MDRTASWMQFEVEMKFRAGDHGAIVQHLAALASSPSSTERHVDRYFNHPVRDFAQTDEALRIRSIGDQNRITYKGPKIDATTKTRREIEIAVGDGAATADGLEAILELLGFRPSGVVRKTREKFPLQWEERAVEFAFDNVAGLGEFVELETVARPDEVDAARAALQRLAELLGLDAGIRQSYLQMLLDAKPGD